MLGLPESLFLHNYQEEQPVEVTSTSDVKAQPTNPEENEFDPPIVPNAPEEVDNLPQSLPAPPGRSKRDVPDSYEDLLQKTGQFLKDSQRSHSGFLTIFLDEPGATARVNGPLDGTVQAAVIDIDDFVGRLLELLHDNTHFIVVSTPGFTQVLKKNVIDLQQDVEEGSHLNVVGSPTVLNIREAESLGKLHKFHSTSFCSELTLLPQTNPSQCLRT